VRGPITWSAKIRETVPPFYFFAATSPERFSPPVIFAGNELQNRTKGVRRAGTEDTVVETLFGSYFYDLLLRVRIARRFPRRAIPAGLPQSGIHVSNRA